MITYNFLVCRVSATSINKSNNTMQLVYCQYVWNYSQVVRIVSMGQSTGITKEQQEITNMVITSQTEQKVTQMNLVYECSLPFLLQVSIAEHLSNDFYSARKPFLKKVWNFNQSEINKHNCNVTSCTGNIQTLCQASGILHFSGQLRFLLLTVLAFGSKN